MLRFLLTGRLVSFERRSELLYVAYFLSFYARTILHIIIFNVCFEGIYI